MVETNPETNLTLYNAFQWAVLSIRSGCGLCKGTFVINETLPPQTLLCRESCVQMTYPAPGGPIPWSAQLGFDVINTSSYQHPPRLNPQVVGALLLRVTLMEDSEAASQKLRSLEQWLGRLRQVTAESWAAKEPPQDTYRSDRAVAEAVVSGVRARMVSCAHISARQSNLEFTTSGQ